MRIVFKRKVFCQLSVLLTYEAGNGLEKTGIVSIIYGNSETKHV